MGAKLAESKGLPESVVGIIKKHVGGGITAQEAEAFGWAKDIYVPITMEEKIVSYADKLIDKSQCVPIDLEIKRLQEDNKGEAAERVRKIHDEIVALMDERK